MVTHLHRQCIRTGTLAPNVRIVCVMLYGTSSLIFLRCIFRAVQTSTQYTGKCGTYYCCSVSNDEWYLYVFETAPIVLYTLWLSIIYPGRFLPTEHKRYLDPDGKTERAGPRWIDKRSQWMTFIDLFDVAGGIKGRPENAQFWLRPRMWPACEDGTFALGTASNRKKRRVEGKESA